MVLQARDAIKSMSAQRNLYDPSSLATAAQFRRYVFLLALVNGIDHMHKLSRDRNTVLAFYGAWHTRRCDLAALTRIGDSALSVSCECTAFSIIISTIIPLSPLRHTR